MTATTFASETDHAPTAWIAVISMSLMTFLLVASEFMPVSLLTPIAADLGITEGQAGQGISISGLFAIATSLFGNALLWRLDRRTIVLGYSVVLLAAGLATALAPNYLVYLFGRALVGVAVGGFWSLSTAIVARLVTGAELPKAIATLQVGTALAAVFAAPLGAFLGGLVGWRGAFFALLPITAIAFLWQLAVLPKLPPTGRTSPARMFGLLRSRVFVIGMAATTLAFMGQFALSTYLRPFLETVTGLGVNEISLMLFGIGAAGLAGTSLIGFILRRHLGAALITLPAVLATIAVVLVIVGADPVPTIGFLLIWGLCTTPIPVAWNTWMTRLIPHELEAGGSLQVALIQFAIGSGAAIGGLLFDAAGWWSPFVLGAVLLAGSALFSVIAARSLHKEAV